MHAVVNINIVDFGTTDEIRAGETTKGNIN